MKFIVSQMVYLMGRKSSRRNLLYVMRLFSGMVLLIALSSVLFHYIMELEGHYYSPITGLYWTLTVMTTLGFGDITFASDIGRAFTIVVLLSGILFFMLMLPFTFIRFVYAPWLDAQANGIAPRKLPEETQGHVILVGYDDFAKSIANYLQKYNLPYVMLTPDSHTALPLYDSGFKVVVGEADTPATYISLQAPKAALVLALYDDMKNTNIASTVREVAPEVPLAARIQHRDSYDILQLAGCRHVFLFADKLGRFLARRVFSHNNASNTIGRFEGFCIAESPAHGSVLVGRTLRDINLTGTYGLNVVGIWQGSDYMPVSPETMVDDTAVLLLAGTEENLARYDASIKVACQQEDAPVLILGGGSVANAVAETLDSRHIPYRIVEKNGNRIPEGDARYVHGSAADIAVLKAAGIDATETVVVTTHDDDVNIYLTIYCRKLRPEIQIISRANLDRNVVNLYSAGANLVVSQAGMMATTVVNLLTPNRVFMLTEGMNVFRMPLPASLRGKNLLSSHIRSNTECNVLAIATPHGVQVPPNPHAQLNMGDELVLIGSTQSEKLFMEKYC